MIILYHTYHIRSHQFRAFIYKHVWILCLINHCPIEVTYFIYSTSRVRSLLQQDERDPRVKTSGPFTRYYAGRYTEYNVYYTVDKR